MSDVCFRRFVKNGRTCDFDGETQHIRSANRLRRSGESGDPSKASFVRRHRAQRRSCRRERRGGLWVVLVNIQSSMNGLAAYRELLRPKSLRRLAHRHRGRGRSCKANAVRNHRLRLFSKAAQPLPAIGQMHPHGGPRGVRFLPLDGVVNRPVFAVHAIQVGALFFFG